MNRPPVFQRIARVFISENLTPEPESGIPVFSVERKNIEEDPLIERLVPTSLLDKRRTAVSHFREDIDQIGFFFSFEILNVIIFLTYRRRFLDENLIIAPRHSDVDIVVPRNKSAVTYGTETRSPDGKISQMQRLAKPHELLQQVHGNRLQFIHVSLP